MREGPNYSQILIQELKERYNLQPCLTWLSNQDWNSKGSLKGYRTPLNPRAKNRPCSSPVSLPRWLVHSHYNTHQVPIDKGGKPKDQLWTKRETHFSGFLKWQEFTAAHRYRENPNNWGRKEGGSSSTRRKEGHKGNQTGKGGGAS